MLLFFFAKGIHHENLLRYRYNIIATFPNKNICPRDHVNYTIQHNTAPLADEGNYTCSSLAAHTTLNTYKHFKIRIERLSQH